MGTEGLCLVTFLATVRPPMQMTFEILVVILNNMLMRTVGKLFSGGNQSVVR